MERGRGTVSADISESAHVAFVCNITDKMRPRSKIMAHFITSTENNKDKYTCKYCDTVYTNKNATKFARHIIKCNKAPVEIKNDFDKKAVDNVPCGSSASTSAIVVPQLPSVSDSNMSLVDNTEVHRILSRAIYVTGQPLSLLEHPIWKEALQALRPEYEAPSRKMLSTSLLNEEYTKVKNEINEKIQQAKILHIAVDGWSNLRNDSIINIIIFATKPYFYKFLDTKNNRHTSEYLAEEIAKVIEELSPNKFMAFITDNAANMVKCAKLLNSTYKNIMWFGCIAHTLHLLIGDMLQIPCVKNVFKFVVAVIKCITHSHILSAEYRQRALEKSITASLLLPVKTRWGSYLNCLLNYNKLKVVLQLLVVNTEHTELVKYKTKLLNEDMWSSDICGHIELIKPVVNWITKLEGDYGTIHLVHRALSDINAVLNNNTTESLLGEQCESIRNKFTQRKLHSLKPVHYAAAILDHKNQGVNLTNAENLDGCQFIMDHNECDGQRGLNVLEELAHYKSRSNAYARDFIWASSSVGEISPLSWWQLFFPNTSLGKIAVKILSIPSTSASVERSFSTFSHIHTPKRNKLTTERAGKICFIAHNWKLLNQNTHLLQKSTPEDLPDDESAEDVEFDFVETNDESLYRDFSTELDEDPLSVD